MEIRQRGKSLEAAGRTQGSSKFGPNSIGSSEMDQTGARCDQLSRSRDVEQGLGSAWLLVRWRSLPVDIGQPELLPLGNLRAIGDESLEFRELSTAIIVRRQASRWVDESRLRAAICRTG